MGGRPGPIRGAQGEKKVRVKQGNPSGPKATKKYSKIRLEHAQTAIKEKLTNLGLEPAGMSLEKFFQITRTNLRTALNAASKENRSELTGRIKKIGESDGAADLNLIIKILPGKKIIFSTEEIN